MLNLLFKISGDINDLKKSLAKVPDEAAKVGKDAGDSMGNALGSQFKSILMGAVGFGALKSIMARAVQDANSVVETSIKNSTSIEDTQKIMRVSKATGMSFDEIKQGMAANPKAFSALVENVTRLNPITDAKTIQQLAEAGEIVTSFSEQTKPLIAAASTIALAGANNSISSRYRSSGIGNAYSGMGAIPFSSMLNNASSVAGADRANVIEERVRLSNQFKQSVGVGQFWQDNGQQLQTIISLLQQKL